MPEDLFNLFGGQFMPPVLLLMSFQVDPHHVEPLGKKCSNKASHVH